MRSYRVFRQPLQDLSRLTSTPNFIILVADDMRWDTLGVAGNPIVKTPNLDRLAHSGIHCVENFTPTAICPTGRANIMTGQFARRHGIWDFSTPLSPEQFSNTYHALLREAGYHLGFIGKWGLGVPLPEAEFDFWAGFENQGFYYGPDDKDPEHLTDKQLRQARGFLESLPRDRPFCLSVSFKAPHGPFRPQKRFAALYDEVTIPRPRTDSRQHADALPEFIRSSLVHRKWAHRYAEDADYQRRLRKYYALVTGIDDMVGSLVSDLKARGLYDNSCIIFTSDHGLFMSEHRFIGKWYGFEEAIRTPMIAKLPGERKPKTVRQMTLNVDIHPTMMDLAGLPTPARVQGSSLIPLIEGTKSKLREDWFYEHRFEGGGILVNQGIRTERFKYLAFGSPDILGELLFDLKEDPFEENNLIDDAASANIIEQLRQRTSDLRTRLA